jgi:hypothetical protein
VDGEDGEPVVEILPERAAVDEGFQVAVGGPAMIRTSTLVTALVADAADFAFLERPEHLDLELGRQFGDLVQEEGAGHRRSGRVRSDPAPRP